MHGFPMAAWFRPTLIALLGLGSLAALPARAADHTLKDIRVDLGFMRVTIPTLEVRGTPLDAAGIASLFDPKSPETAIERLSRLNATSMAAPDVVIEQDLGAFNLKAIYRSVAASGIVAGRIAQANIASQSISFAAPTANAGSAATPAKPPVPAPAPALPSLPDRFEGRAGPTTMEGLDLAVAARMLTVAAAPGAKPPLETYLSRLELRDFVLDLGTLGTSRLGTFRQRDVKGRQGDIALMPLMERLRAFTEKQEADKATGVASKPSPDEMRLLTRAFSLIQNFEYGEMEANDVVVALKTPDGPGDMRIARMGIIDRNIESGGGSIRLDGLDFAAGPVKMLLDRFEFKGFSLARTFAALAEAARSGDLEGSIAANPAALIPKLGTVSLAGLSIEAPDEKVKNAAGKPETLKLGLKGLNFGFGPQLSGIPTGINVAVDGLSMPLYAREQRDGLKDLADMGYKALDVSMAFDSAWNEATSEFSIGKLSVSGVDMGSVTLSGLLGNITKDVFTTDAALAQVALLGASAKRLDVTVQDNGLFGRVLAREARAKRKSVDDLRREYGTVAAIGLPAILGPSEGAKAIAAAVSRFVAKPGTLSISAAARTPSGIGLADVITLTEPQAIFEQLDVKASAE
jgi:hypothetical protein